MKKKYILLAALSIFFLSFQVNETTKWKLDPVHSNLGFSIWHLGVSNIKGTVKLNSSSIETANEDFSDATISMEADMSTIDTDNDKRDAHLKTPDFFDCTQFPTVNFQSTSFKKEGQGHVILGNLTLHGITKPVKLNATIITATNPVNNKPITGIKVTGTIKRSDFGIATATPVAILTDEVSIEANMEFAKE